MNTLLRSLFGATHRYVSLEAPHVRERAVADPVGFLADHPAPVVLDEIQHVPALLPYLQVAIDEDRRPGRWLLSRSQSFPLLQGTSESLAGRVAILTLLPLSASEIQRRARAQEPVEKALGRVFEARRTASRSHADLGQWLLRGGFPQLWSQRGLDRRLWLGSYVQTYLERDVRSVLGVRDLGAFQTFLRLAAARTAQVLNVADLARHTGVSPPTVRQWLSVLEASHQDRGGVLAGSRGESVALEPVLRQAGATATPPRAAPSAGRRSRCRPRGSAGGGSRRRRAGCCRG